MKENIKEDYIYNSLKENNIKTLSDKEQIEMFKELRKTNDSSIREKLIISNIESVYNMISKCNFIKIDDDVMQIALEGLIKAVDNYDPDSGFDFYNYSSKIIINGLRRHYCELRESFGGNQNPSWQISFKENRKIVEDYYNCSITDDETLIEKVVDLMIEDKVVTKKSKESNIKRIKLHFCNISLEENYEELSQIEDSIYEERLENIINDIDLVQLKDKINEILEDIPLREKQIIEMKYGLNGQEIKSTSEIAQIYGLTVSRIGQIEDSVLNKFNYPKNKLKLCNYTPDGEFFYQTFNRLKKEPSHIRNLYFNEYIKYIRRKDLKSAKEVLLEYDYYSKNKDEAFRYLRDLLLTEDPLLIMQLRKIITIFTEKELYAISGYVLRKDKYSLCIYADSCEELTGDLRTLASSIKKLCYYYHYMDKNNVISDESINNNSVACLEENALSDIVLKSYVNEYIEKGYDVSILDEYAYYKENKDRVLKYLNELFNKDNFKLDARNFFDMLTHEERKIVLLLAFQKQVKNLSTEEMNKELENDMQTLASVIKKINYYLQYYFDKGIIYAPISRSKILTRFDKKIINNK